MTTGLVLIAAVLILGGVIATVGDRIGMRVGKSRLTLFNLRPRQTATLITILTGVMVSASTFALLFAVSGQLRTGVFELENIQADLRGARDELKDTRTERDRIETRLKNARKQQSTAQQRLARINQSLKQAINQQEQTQTQLKTTQQRLNESQAKFQQAQQLLSTVSEQATSLSREIQQLQADRQELIRQRDLVREQIAQRDQEIAQRDREVAQRDQEIAQRDQAIVMREDRLKDLETQITFLAEQKDALEREFEDLRRGNVTLFRNQTLAWGVVRVDVPTAAPKAVDRLLQRANQLVAQIIQPGTTQVNQQVIRITNAQVEQLASQIADGQDYVVRVIAAGNYVVGEPCVLAGEPCIDVIATAAPNQVVFRRGEVIATTAVNPTMMDQRSLGERIFLLVAAAQFRCRQAGILDDTVRVADNRRETVLNFIEKVRQSPAALEIQAIAVEDAYTAGAHLELIAIQNGKILFSTS